MATTSISSQWRISTSMSFSAKASETCCQYNTLKPTRALFLHDPRVEYADYYERTLFNGILASQDPDSGMPTYFHGARPRYMKLYHTPESSFWCCTGTGMENHVRYRDSIYFHDDAALYVNLFVPSSAAWKEKRAELVQATTFSDAPATTLRWKLDQPVNLTLKLRHPGWSRTAIALVNGVEASGSIAPAVVAFTYGPLVLAGAFGQQGLAPGSGIVANERKYGTYNDVPFAVPTLAGNARTPTLPIRAGGTGLEFTMPSAEGGLVRLVPYH
jgi:uncharacterized protein